MPNSFYNVAGVPATSAPGASSTIRTEFSAIAAAFDLFPTLSGFANKAFVVNSAGTAVTLTAGSLALAGNFTTTGAFNTTLIAGATVSLTLPLVSGTLATLAGTETLTNKTLTSAVLNTPTINNPAFSGTSTGSLTLAGLTAPSPIISGTITGTYTIGGTPTGSLVRVLSTGSTTERNLATRHSEEVNPKDWGAVGDGATSDQTAVAAAVAAAFADGRRMFWPDGTYLTTATIPNLHDVVHRGPGVVSRGASLFYVEPISTQTNTLYVATTGSNTNDGLTASEPMLTIQNAVDKIVGTRRSPCVNPWVINAAAGTYNNAVLLPDGMFLSNSYLTIAGPTVASIVTVPTLILDGTALSKVNVLDCGALNKVHLKYIKFTGWGASANCAAISVGGFLWATDIWNDDGSRSLMFIDRQCVGLLEGGKKDTGLIGVDCYSGSTLTIGYNATSNADSTTISNTTQAGLYLKSSCHAVGNYVNYTSNAVAVHGYYNSRYDTKGDNFVTNTRVFKMQGSAVSENISPASNYNHGGGSANTIVWELDQYSSRDIYHADARSGLDVYHSNTSTTLTGTIAATVARSMFTVEAYSFVATGRYIIVECVVTGTGSAATKTVQLKLGTVVIGTYTLATGTVTAKFRAMIWAANTTSVVVINEVSGSFTLVSAMRAQPAVTMTSDQALEVWFTISGAADTCVMRETRVEFWGT